jgi:Fe-S-cluster containining protein
VTKPADQTAEALWSLWRAASAQPAIDAALRSLYQRLADEVARRSPTCWISGRCCNFEKFGHRLYVTGLEIAWMLRQLDPAALPAPADIDLRGPCVFQQNRLCSVHRMRPLGCRIFFCQQGTQQWQQDLYEALLKDLRQLHEESGLPYRYMEWRAGLAEALAELSRPQQAAATAPREQ